MHTNPDILALLALGEDLGPAPEVEHVARCEVCSRELAELERLAQIGRAAAGDTLQAPSPQVWERIVAELGLGAGNGAAPPPANVRSLVERTGPPANGRPADRSGDRPTARRAAPAPEPASRGRRPRMSVPFVALAVAAALFLVAGIGIGYAISRFSRPAETVLGCTRLDALPAWSGSRGEACVQRDPQGNRTLVVDVSASRQVGGNSQVWLIDTQVQGMSSLGFLTNGRGRFPVPANLDLAQFPIVDVSDEPSNDPAPAHSGNSIVRGTLSL